MPRAKAVTEPAPEATAVNKPPVRTRSTKKKSERDKITRAQAIKLQCMDCMNFQKYLIKDCPDFQCPLWTFRMGPQEHSDIPVRTKKG
jgi:hypothetical protein